MGHGAWGLGRVERPPGQAWLRQRADPKKRKEQKRNQEAMDHGHMGMQNVRAAEACI